MLCIGQRFFLNTVSSYQSNRKKAAPPLQEKFQMYTPMYLKRTIEDISAACEYNLIVASLLISYAVIV